MRSLSHAVVLGLLACGPALAADGVPRHITIASEGARPPYNYFDGDKLEGFEIDLGRELCTRMSVDCTFVSQTWDDMIPGLVAHRYDAIMAAMEIDKRRLALIAFSTPYVRMPSAFIVQKRTDLRSATPEALSGRRIGVERGGTHQAFIEKIYPDSAVRKYGSLGDALLDLEAGRVDVAIGDKDAIVTFLEARRDAACCRILDDVPRYAAFFGDGIGVGLRKEDVALKAAFDSAIAAVMADGTYARLSARYFDFPINGPEAGPAPAPGASMETR
jgi:polar amino acid transport system substrate-binding protein